MISFWYITSSFIFCIYTLDGSLSSEISRRAFIQCTDVIVESGIDPLFLARRLYSEEIIPEDLYKRVRDTTSRDTNEERIEKICDYITDRVSHYAGIFTKFVNILRYLNRQDLADFILSKYKGIIHYEYI